MTLHSCLAGDEDQLVSLLSNLWTASLRANIKPTLLMKQRTNRVFLPNMVDIRCIWSWRYATYPKFEHPYVTALSMVSIVARITVRFASLLCVMRHTFDCL